MSGVSESVSEWVGEWVSRLSCVVLSGVVSCRVVVWGEAEGVDIPVVFQHNALHHTAMYCEECFLCFVFTLRRTLLTLNSIIYSNFASGKHTLVRYFFHG